MKFFLFSAMILAVIGCGSTPAPKKDDAGVGGSAPAATAVASVSATVVPAAEPSVAPSASVAPVAPTASASAK